MSRVPLLTPRQGGTLVVAHRGSHLSIPENTLAAYGQAITQGADFIEIDVRQTADGKLISHHNATIKLAPQGPSQEIFALSLAQLQSLNIAGPYGEPWRKERIPELGEILKLCKAKIGVYLDLKQAPVDSVVALVKQWHMTQEVLWYADDEALQRIADLCPDCLIMPDPGPISKLRSVIQRFHPQVIATTWQHFSAAFADECHRAGATVIMDDEGPACWDQALRWRCDGIQTDHPAELIDYLRRR